MVVAQRGFPRPSPHQRFARNASQSVRPQDWRGLIWVSNPSLQAPGGTALRNWAGRVPNGALTSMAPATDWVLDGAQGRVLDFDFSDDRVEIPANGPIGNLTQCTILAWVKDSGTGSGDETIYERSNGFKAGTLTLYSSAVSRDARFFVNTSAAFDQVNPGTASRMDDGNYHFLAGTYDEVATTIRLYFDGKDVGSEATAGTLTNLPNDITFMGGRGATLTWDGRIGQFRIYNRVLSASHILGIHQDQLGMWRLKRRVLGRVAAAAPQSISPSPMGRVMSVLSPSISGSGSTPVSPSPLGRGQTVNAPTVDATG